MKAAPFDYLSPRSLEEATVLLGEHGDDAKVLAGGQSLVPMLGMRLARFPVLVDVGRVDELRGWSTDGAAVTIGGTVRQCEVEGDAGLATSVPLLQRATPFIGHFQIRSRGTVGGSIAHADPAAEYPAVALALDAEMLLASAGGSRVVPASEFFTGTWSTAAVPDEVLVGVRFRPWGAGCGYAVEEVSRRHGDFAVAGACAAVQVAGTRIVRAAVALFGVAATPVRSAGAEQALLGASALEVQSEEVGRLAAGELDPPDDVHASAGLRRHVGATVVARAVRRAVAEASDE